MFISDIKRIIDQVSRDKGIDSEVLIRALEEALKSAARKKYGNRIDIEVQYNDEVGEIEVFQFKEVVEEVTDPEVEFTVTEGKALDPECEVGDSLGIKMDTGAFGRIAAQSAKQVIIQKMKDAERDAVYSTFIDRKGEIINGIVQRIERGSIIVNLGQTEGGLPEREQVPREVYRRGDRVRAYILDVHHESRGPQVILSRSHPSFLISLFKTEVPEISEGIVTIVGAVREPGSRAKIAVASSDSDIDPVGACVGMKGSRVQNVVQELRGEKIDIIPWHVDPAKFVCNALAPAEIARVIIDEENRSMEVIVPDEFLSVAIGKRGQNVRLASKLTRWRLDVKSESSYNEAMQQGYNSLMALPDVSIGLADALYEKGFFSAEEVSKASVEDLTQVRGLDEEDAENLIEIAQDYVINEEAFEEEAEEEEEEAETEAEGDTDEAFEDQTETEAGTDEEPEAGVEDRAGTDEDSESPTEADAEKETDAGTEPVAEAGREIDTAPEDDGAEEDEDGEEADPSDAAAGAGSEPETIDTAGEEIDGITDSRKEDS